MSNFDILFIVMALGIGFIAWLILFMRFSFEPIEADSTEDTQKIDYISEDKEERKLRNIARDEWLDEIGVGAKAIDDGEFEDTTPPESEAVFLAIQYLEDREGDWL